MIKLGEWSQPGLILVPQRLDLACMTTKLASHTTSLNVENHDSPVHLSASISADVCEDEREAYPPRSKKVSSTIESKTRRMSRS